MKTTILAEKKITYILALAMLELLFMAFAFRGTGLADSIMR